MGEDGDKEGRTMLREAAAGEGGWHHLLLLECLTHFFKLSIHHGVPNEIKRFVGNDVCLNAVR